MCVCVCVCVCVCACVGAQCLGWGRKECNFTLGVLLPSTNLINASARACTPKKQTRHRCRSNCCLLVVVAALKILLVQSKHLAAGAVLLAASLQVFADDFGPAKATVKTHTHKTRQLCACRVKCGTYVRTPTLARTVQHSFAPHYYRQ